MYVANKTDKPIRAIVTQNKDWVLADVASDIALVALAGLLVGEGTGYMFDLFFSDQKPSLTEALVKDMSRPLTKEYSYGSQRKL